MTFWDRTVVERPDVSVHSVATVAEILFTFVPSVDFTIEGLTRNILSPFRNSDIFFHALVVFIR